MKYTEKEEVKMIEIPEDELKRREFEFNGLTRKYQMVLDFLSTLSFYPTCESKQSLSIYSARANLCSCGEYPLIIKSLYEKGKWIAQCQKCTCRTVEAVNPVQAVKLWNAGQFTEESRLLKKKMEPQEVSTEGLISLCDAVTRESIKDLKLCTITDNLDSPMAKEARDWIRNKKTIAEIESGDWIEKDQEEEKNCIELQSSCLI